MDAGLQKAVRIAIRTCMAVKKGETVLVIADEPWRCIGYALWGGSPGRGRGHSH